ncbi:unnamed protein product [Sphagnum tenellum]
MNGKGTEFTFSMYTLHKIVRMWGYLPAASPQRLPLLQPTPVPPAASSSTDSALKIVCNGGCGFALAISESGKLNTWGSTTDLGQCYLISGKQQEVPEPYPLQIDTPIIQAAAGWAHCAAVTGKGEVYTWGWSECVPNGKSSVDSGINASGRNTEVVVEDTSDSIQSASLLVPPWNSSDVGFVKASPSASPLNASGVPLVTSRHAMRPGHRNTAGGKVCEKVADEVPKKRRLANTEEAGPSENASAADENVFAPPCLVGFEPGVRIISVAAGGRHTLALSDGGQVWGWGYGGEGQLGLGSRLRVISTPQLIPCLGTPEGGLDQSRLVSGCFTATVPGNYIKAIACGGRHSAVITDAGALLTFGWGLYGQCGQGSTDDEMSPCHVATLVGLPVSGVAAGLWHTLCITDSGDVYACGGNQFGQLGVGGDHAEMLPRLVESPILEDETMISVASGARHSAVLTETGKMFSWGWNKYGQLGLGDSSDRDLPVQVAITDADYVSSIACGWWHTLAVVYSKVWAPTY